MNRNASWPQEANTPLRTSISRVHGGSLPCLQNAQRLPLPTPQLDGERGKRSPRTNAAGQVSLSTMLSRGVWGLQNLAAADREVLVDPSAAEGDGGAQNALAPGADGIAQQALKRWPARSSLWIRCTKSSITAAWR